MSSPIRHRSPEELAHRGRHYWLKREAWRKRHGQNDASKHHTRLNRIIAIYRAILESKGYNAPLALMLGELHAEDALAIEAAEYETQGILQGLLITSRYTDSDPE